MGKVKNTSSNGKASKDVKPKPTVQSKSNEQYLITRMFRFLLRWSFFLAVCLISGATVSILMNCVEGGTKIPSSKPLCADLSRLSEFKKPSSKFINNVRTTYGTVFENYKRLATPYWNKVSFTTKSYYRKAVKSDIGKAAEKYVFMAHTFVVEKVLLAHRFLNEQFLALKSWYARDGHKVVGNVFTQVKVVGGIIYEMAKDGASFVADALLILYHRTETFLVQWQEKGFAKALENII